MLIAFLNSLIIVHPSENCKLMLLVWESKFKIASPSFITYHVLIFIILTAQMEKSTTFFAFQVFVAEVYDEVISNTNPKQQDPVQLGKEFEKRWMDLSDEVKEKFVTYAHSISSNN